LLCELATDVTAMLSRVAACWLVVLVLAPFTAPFPTCDFAALFGGEPMHQAPANAPGHVALACDSTIASVPAISGLGRVRLLPVSCVCAAAGQVSPAQTNLLHASAFSDDARDHAALTTILRV
jgi:hypothetical protein